MDAKKKVSWLLGIIIGILQGIIFGIKGGIIVGLLAGLISAIVLEIVFSFILKKAYQDGTGAYGYRELLNFHYGFDKSFALCNKALEIIKNHKVLQKDITNGRLVAKLGMTLESWGELITFQLTKIDDANTEIEITSKQIISSPVYNYDGPKKVISHLRELGSKTENNVKGTP